MSAARAARPPATPLAAVELVNALADVARWPRSRPARLLTAELATRVGTAALCLTDAAIADLDPRSGEAVLLASAPSELALRRGRRAYDIATGDEPAAWARAERVVIDAGELLAGGHGGFDELLADALGLGDTHPLEPVTRGEVKVVGFVPHGAVDGVRAALFAAGAGVIGDYAECSWSTEGIGTFRGSEGTSPAIGEPGRFEQADELRIEVVCPAHRRDAVCRAFVAAHPYEEPAFDVYELATPARVGHGRVGRVAGAPDGVAAQLAAVLGADVVVDATPAGEGALVLVTTDTLASLLGTLLARGDVGLVVCAGASVAERGLLAERGVGLVTAPREALQRPFAERVAGTLSRRLGIAVTFTAGLAFPTAPNGSSSHARTTPTSPEAGGEAAGSGATGPQSTEEAPISSDTPTSPESSATPAYKGAGVPVQLWFDGGSRGNPGPAAAAFVLYDTAGVEVERTGVELGHTTNNVAEYNGLISGLRRALDLGATRLEIYSDSELIVKQVKGLYRVKHEAMKPLHQEASSLLRNLKWYEITHVLRERNAVADATVNETLDAAGAR